MPAVQATPPGHLELHVVVVALTPALLVAVTGTAVALVGGGKLARWLGWLAMASAVAIEALFLLPLGLAAAFTFPIGHGWLRVGTGQVICSLLSGLVALLSWRPAPLTPALAYARWSWKTALALAMPLTLAPVLGLLAMGEPPAMLAGAAAPAWRRRRLLIGFLATVLVATTLAVDDGDRWLPRVAAAIGFALLAGLAPSRWRACLLLAALAGILPLPADSALAG